MPIRGQMTVFTPDTRLNPSHNPWVGKLLAAPGDSRLPILFGDELRTQRGRWRSRHPENPDAALIFELGCHLGKTIREMASELPRIFFVGVDITFKRVVTAAERITAAGLRNAATVISPAQAMDEFIADGEADAFVIFFPDPWTKRAQAKNRLLTQAFAELLVRKLRPGGLVWFKTDRPEYFATGKELFVAAGLSEMAQSTHPFFGGHAFESTFERRFRLAGEATWGAVFQRSKALSSGPI